MIITQSCNLHIEKRRYRKGYFVEVSNKNKRDEVSRTQNIENKVVQFEKNNVQLITQQKAHIDSLKQVPFVNYKKIQKTGKNTLSGKKPITKIPFHKKSGDGDCDIIHLNDGTEIEALVVNITDNEITYKKCNFLDGPSYKISAGKVKSIDLKNGDVYTPSKNSKGQDYSNVTPGMIAGMITAGIALICVVIAMILLFGASYYGLIAAIPLAVAGITSLIGICISVRYLQKGSHPLGKAAFYSNLGLQILAIILTAIMFVLIF